MKLVLAFILTSLVTATTAYSDGPRSPRANAEVSTTETHSSYRPVQFVAADGRKLIGRLWGTGDVGVILAHGFSQASAQDDWGRFVPSLVSRGYTVLTFNFRGFCDTKGGCSEGGGVTRRGLEFAKNWRDAMAAVEFMETRGAKKIFLIGASMGGIAVLRAARMPEVDVAGVVSLATPQWPSKYYAVPESPANDVTPARLRQIDEPKLFVAGTRDIQVRKYEPLLRPGVKRVSFAADARRMFAAAEEPKELVLVDSSSHSSELVTGPTVFDFVKQTRAVVFQFLSEHSR